MISGRWIIPDSWDWVTAGQIANIVGGGTPKTGDPDNFCDIGIPWLTPADLSKNQNVYVERGSRDISLQGLKTSSAKLLPKGTVLFTSRAPIGYCVIAANEISTNQGFKSLVLCDKISPEFVRYYLIASKSYAESLASGSTFKELSGQRANSLEIPLPPLNEQRRIVAKIEGLTARSRKAREALDAISPLLDQFRQSVLAAAFRGDLTADWRAANPDVEPAEKLLERIRVEKNISDSTHAKKKTYELDVAQLEDFYIPSEWELTLSCDLFSYVTSGSRGWAKYYSEEGAIFLRVGNLNRNTISLDLENLQRVNPPEGAEGIRTKVQIGDILISITADVGMIGLVPVDLSKAYINQHVALARPFRNIEWEYLAWYLASSQGGAAQFKELQRGATKAGLGLDDIRSIWVPIPSLMEQKEIVRCIKDALDVIEAVEKQYRESVDEITILDQSILAKAFRGELVPQDPNDEPANVLLDRIRGEREKAQKPEKVSKGKKNR